MYVFAKATRLFLIQGLRAFAKWVLPRPSPSTGRNLDESPVEGCDGGLAMGRGLSRFQVREWAARKKLNGWVRCVCSVSFECSERRA